MATHPKPLNESLVRNLPDEGPVVMVNLLRMRPRSLDGNGTGWDAYSRYSHATMKLIKARGGTVLRGAIGDGVAFGDAAKDGWDYVVLVRYQYGTNLAKATPNFWKQIVGCQWQAAYNNLMNFGDAYPSRRRLEAAELLIAINSGTLPSPPQS